MDSIKILPFGGCRINNPFSYAATSDSRLRPMSGSWVPAIYTFKEIIQIIDVWNGDTHIPADIAPFLSNWSGRLIPQPGLIAEADVVLLETSSETEFSLEGLSVNRAAISDKILQPVKAISKDAHRHLSKWYNNGLVGFNEELREHHSKELVKFIPDDMESAEMLRRMIVDLRAERADARAGFREILDRIDVPLGYITHVWQFFTDGRLMNWPAGYHESVDEARIEFGIPVFRPEELVVAAGVTNAMRGDLRHYADEFLPLISTQLVDFAMDLRNGAGARLDVAV